MKLEIRPDELFPPWMMTPCEGPDSYARLMLRAARERRARFALPAPKPAPKPAPPTAAPAPAPKFAPVPDAAPGRLTVPRIIARTAAHFGYSVVETLGHCRKRGPSRARHVGMYLAKTLTTRSLPDIGRRFAGRDHTTVLHAIRKIEALMAADPAFAAEVAALAAELAPSSAAERRGC